ncbi:hypothetical protein GX408_07295 [bacterium]|nr:hypothetical protein [bacterium]
MLTQKEIDQAVAVMCELNRAAAAIARDHSVHACTDVTGFGLLGHLLEMTRGSRMDVEIFWERVPMLERAWDLAAAGMVPGGTRNNLDYVLPHLVFSAGMPEIARLLLADAQTSGGLLLAVPQDEASLMTEKMQKVCSFPVAAIGSVTGSGEEKIRLI